MKTIEEYLEDIKNPDFKIRAEAADNLGSFKDLRAVEPLINLVQNDDYAAVRWGAVWSLGLLNDVRAMDTLIDVMKQDKHPGIRYRAAQTIKKLMKGGVKELRIQAMIAKLGGEANLFAIIETNLNTK